MSKIEKLIQQLCPEGVEFKELGEIGKVCMCKRIMKHETNSIGEIPFYKIGTFGKTADAFISKELYNDYKKKYSFPKLGDILISASGTIGRTVIYDDKPAYFQDSNIVWINNDETIVSNKFLFYYYKIVEWKTDGGTISRLYNNNLMKTIIPIPPLPIQQEIVAILDKFTQLEAELEAELEARKTQYEYYRNELLNFEGKEVEWKTLGEVADVTKLAGYEFTAHIKYSNDGTIIALRALNVKNGYLDTTSVKYIDDSNFLKLSRSKLYVNDMLFTYVGTIGEVALIDENDKYYLAPNVARIRFLDDKINPIFMRYYFQSTDFINNQINRFLSTSSLKNLTMRNIRKFNIPIPPLSEQERIVAILDKFDALVNDISVGLPAEIKARRQQYEFYRGKLLDFKNISNG